MLDRRILPRILHDLEIQAAVVLLGPRQVGKTTLARAIAEQRPSIYLDLEDPADRDKLTAPALFLQGRGRMRVQSHRPVQVCRWQVIVFY